jgi:enoyl-[acyl-carrier protein] reductase II
MKHKLIRKSVLKTPRSDEHAKNTLQKSPGVFLGIPDDINTMDLSLIVFEIESIEAAQRINDMPKVNDMVQVMVKEAEDILKGVQKKLLA